MSTALREAEAANDEFCRSQKRKLRAVGEKLKVAKVTVSENMAVGTDVQGGVEAVVAEEAVEEAVGGMGDVQGGMGPGVNEEAVEEAVGGMGDVQGGMGSGVNEEAVEEAGLVDGKVVDGMGDVQGGMGVADGTDVQGGMGDVQCGMGGMDGTDVRGGMGDVQGGMGGLGDTQGGSKDGKLMSVQEWRKTRLAAGDARIKLIEAECDRQMAEMEHTIQMEDAREKMLISAGRSAAREKMLKTQEPA